MVPEDVTQLDPKVIKVMSTIKKLESDGNYNAIGDNGTSHGAYQWQPNNFQNGAKEHGLDPNDFSPANQNKVAYAQIKAYKDAGRTPEEIDALWNGAHKDTTTGMYVHNNPERAKKFKETILGSSQGFNPKPFSQPTNGTPAPSQNLDQSLAEQKPIQEDPSLGQELQGRGKDIMTGLNSVVEGDKSGQNRFSGLLQTVGGVAGGVGDVVNKGLELIPGVKQVENLLGQGVGALAKTSVGQSVVKSINDFSTAHPELSKDIGAGFNIITAIPILKGLGVVKNVALDATSSALKGIAEKSMAKDLTSTLSRTVGGRKALDQGAGDLVKVLVDERAIPDIEAGKYTTKDAFNKLGQSISDIEDTKLQPALAKANVPETSSRISLEQYKKEAMTNAVNELKDTGPIEKYFERLKAKYGDYPTLQQMNEAKRTVARNISEAGFASPTYTTDKIVRSSLQKAVEDGAKALGLGDVSAINQEMARLIKAQNILKYIEGKPVKTGLVGGLIKDTATVGGEMLGNTTGIPLAGAYLGREAGGSVGKKLTGISKGILNRTGKEAERVSKQELKKKLGGLFGGAVSQKITR